MISPNVNSWLQRILVSVLVVAFAPCANAIGNAADDSAYTSKNTSVTIDVLANDGTLGASEGISVVNTPAHGTALVVTESGIQQIKYTPSTDFTGIDSFGYELSGGTSATVTVTVDISAEAGPDQLSVASGSTVTLDGSASTGPITTYAWTLESKAPATAPAVTLTGGNTKTATFQAPAVTADTTYVFKLAVSGGTGTTPDTDTVTIKVLKPAVLVAEAGPDQLSVVSGSTVTLDGSASTGPITTYAWKLKSKAPASAPAVNLVDSNKPKSSFVAPAVSVDSTYVFELTIGGASGVASDSDVVTVVVKNAPPIAKAGGDQVVDEGAKVELDGSASQDPEGDSLKYLWTSLDDPLIVLDGVAKPEFTAPRVGKAGTVLRFSLVVEDGKGQKSDPDEVKITVANKINDAPEAKIEAVTDSVKPGVTFTLDGSGSTDADGKETIKTYQWSQKADDPLKVEIVKGDSAIGEFRAPAISETTQVTLILTVTDEEGKSGTAQTSVVVTLDETLKKPLANAGEDDIAEAGRVVTLSGAKSHDQNADGSIVAYQWKQLSGPAVQLADADKAKATFTAPAAVGELEFELKVVDNDSLFATDTVSVFVGPKGSLQVDAGQDQVNVEEGSTVSLSGAVLNGSGNEQKIRWRQVDGSGSSVILSDATGSNAFFVTPPVTGGKDAITLSFEFVSWDSEKGVGVDQVDVTVKDNGITGVPDAYVPLRSETEAESPVGFDIPSGNLVSLHARKAPLNERATQKNRPKRIPYGLFDFALKVDNPGDTVTLKIWFPQDMSEGFGWYQFDAETEVWNSYDSSRAVFNGNELLLTLTDGGPGDDDGKKDGFIRDPSGPGSVIAKTKTRIEGSSGGGSLGWLLLGLAGGFGVWRGSRREASGR